MSYLAILRFRDVAFLQFARHTRWRRPWSKKIPGKYQVKIIRWWQDFSCLLDSGTQGEHKVARLCSEKSTGKNLRLRYADGGKTFDACLCQAHKVSTRWGRLCSKKALGKISG